MRKLTPIAINSIIASIALILLVIVGVSIRQDGIEPGDGQIQVADIQEKIVVEIMSRDYMADFSMEYHEYLLKASIDGEQVGIVYFDEDGKIRFDGDKERFEYALYRAFKLREESWGYEKEKK